MMQWHKRVLLMLLGLQLPIAGHALGAFDGELGALWWNSQVDADGVYEVDADTIYAYGEAWWDQKWGGRGALYRTDSLGQGLAERRQWTLDIKRRLFSPTDNTYLALGVGWDDIDLPIGESTYGMRFLAEGRVGFIGFAYLFGQAAMTPWMSDAGDYTDPFGKELEFGLAIDPLPFLSLKAGYRNYSLDFDSAPGDAALSERIDGLFLGGGIHW